MSDPLWPHRLYSPWNSLGQNIGVGSLSLLQGNFPTQESNPGLPHCRQILYQLSQKGSPCLEDWKWSELGLSPHHCKEHQPQWEMTSPVGLHSHHPQFWCLCHNLCPPFSGSLKGQLLNQWYRPSKWRARQEREGGKVYCTIITTTHYAKAFDCVDHNKLWKSLKEMGIPDHLTCLLRNLYAGQEATVRTRYGTTDWFQIGKGVRQGCILLPCLFNLYAEYIMRNAGLDKAHTEIKIAGRNNLRYADKTSLMA